MEKKLCALLVIVKIVKMVKSQGWEAGPGQLGKVMGDIRRAFSVTIARANAMCLLERLSQLGPGAGAAAKRRQVALRLEERRRQDRQAFDLAWQARGASRVGRAFIQWERVSITFKQQEDFWLIALSLPWLFVLSPCIYCEACQFYCIDLDDIAINGEEGEKLFLTKFSPEIYEWNEMYTFQKTLLLNQIMRFDNEQKYPSLDALAPLDFTFVSKS